MDLKYNSMVFIVNFPNSNRYGVWPWIDMKIILSTADMLYCKVPCKREDFYSQSSPRGKTCHVFVSSLSLISLVLRMLVDHMSSFSMLSSISPCILPICCLAWSFMWPQILLLLKWQLIHISSKVVLVPVKSRILDWKPHSALYPAFDICFTLRNSVL